ncbi:putative ribonuclease H-like domain-containing protein, partial [Tanacetum coccineum]
MQMLKLKLESEEESTMALELIRFIKKGIEIGLVTSKRLGWLVQDQTVLGKDYSNLLIADSLLKTIWFINAPYEELSIPEQTATGKGTSNPLMAEVHVCKANCLKDSLYPTPDGDSQRLCERFNLFSQNRIMEQEQTRNGQSLSFDDLYNNIRVFENDEHDQKHHIPCLQVNLVTSMDHEELRQNMEDNKEEDGWKSWNKDGAKYVNERSSGSDTDDHNIIWSRKIQTSELNPNTELDTCNSNISTEPSELVSEPVVNESNVEVQSKVWSDAPIIEEYESDSDDECVSVQTKGLDTPSFANNWGNGFTGNEDVLLCVTDENPNFVKSPDKTICTVFNLENIVPLGGLACLIAKATTDESNLWHRRLGHVNFKNLNRLVKGNLVRGLPTKLFKNDHTVFVLVKKESIHKALLLKAKDVIEFCGLKGIKREYSNARTPQQNGVAERKNRTLIEAARTMLADSFLPNTFWAEAVSTACYVLNRVLVTKPHNKTPYELLTDQRIKLTFMQVNKNLTKIQAQKTKLMLGILKKKMNLIKTALNCQYGIPILPQTHLFQNQIIREFYTSLPEKEANEEAEALRKNLEQETENLVTQAEAAKTSSTNIFSTVSTTAKASGTNFVNTVSIPVSTASPNKGLSFSDTTNSQEDDTEIPPLEDIHEDTTNGIFTYSSYDDEGAEVDFTNLETVVNISSIPTSRINPSHPSALILGDPTSAVQTRSKVNKSFEAHAFVSYVQKQRRNNHKDFHHCLFACFLSQHEPKKISEALEDESWVDAMQEEFVRLQSQLDSDAFSHKLRKASDVDVPSYRFQVTPKTSHLSAVKRIFRDYAGANLAGNPQQEVLISWKETHYWKCKSKTHFGQLLLQKRGWGGEYVAAASCCGQVLWIQNQMLDYGFNFMNTKIYIDNESTICIVKNPVYHSKTKHIAIRHHFIRDAYEKKLIHGSSMDERGKTHHGKSNLFQETPKPLCSTFLPTDIKHCLNVGYTFVNFTTSEAVWKSHVCISRKSWPLFKSKKIAQVVHAWIQSKNSLVKHFEDMRLCRPSKSKGEEIKQESKEEVKEEDKGEENTRKRKH